MKRAHNSGDVIAIALSIISTLLAVPGIVDLLSKGDSPARFSTFLVLPASALMTVATIAYMNRRKIEYMWAKGPFGPNPYDIHTARDEEVKQVYELARSLFGDNITDVVKIQQIQKKYRHGLKVVVRRKRGEKPVVCGYYFMFPINKSCVDAIHAFKFSVSELSENSVATKPKYGHAMYLGAVVGTNWKIRTMILAAVQAASNEVAATKTGIAYARAATADGIRTMRKNGFEPVHRLADNIDAFFYKALPKDVSAPEIDRGDPMPEPVQAY